MESLGAFPLGLALGGFTMKATQIHPHWERIHCHLGPFKPNIKLISNEVMMFLIPTKHDGATCCFLRERRCGPKTVMVLFMTVTSLTLVVTRITLKESLVVVG